MGVVAASVVAAIIAACGCCGCHRHAVQGVAGAVVAPCGSCPHHTLSPSSPSIEGPGGPLRERWPCTLARRQYLAAKEDVSKEKKEREERNHTGSVTEGEP